MTVAERIVSEHEITEDSRIKLRPQSLEDFVGHEEKLMVAERMVRSALERREAPDHLLIYGPPGVGKTALAEVMAKLFPARHSVSTSDSWLIPDIARRQPGVVLVMDELHYIRRQDVGNLLVAMEGTGRHAGTPPWTLIACTNELGRLDQALRDRFGLLLFLDYYRSCVDARSHGEHDAACAEEPLNRIVQRASERLDMELGHAAAAEVARRARGIPRIALRLLRRVRDVSSSPSPELVLRTMRELGVDRAGLDEFDRRYLEALAYRFGGGPVGLRTLAASIGWDEKALANVIEPYLFRLGLVDVGSGGRRLTYLGQRHLREQGW